MLANDFLCDEEAYSFVWWLCLCARITCHTAVTGHAHVHVVQAHVGQQLRPSALFSGLQHSVGYTAGLRPH